MTTIISEALNTVSNSISKISSACIPEKTREWSSSAKLFWYGAIGNATLSLMDLTSYKEGGAGALVNGIHNVSDVFAYGARSLVSTLNLKEKTTQRTLTAINGLALTATALVTAKAGVDLAHSNPHIIEPQAAGLSMASSFGNFVIASGLEETDRDDDHTGHAHGPDDLCPQIKAREHGHNHASADAAASLIASSGISAAAITGNSKVDLIGTVLAGAYFIWDIGKHIWSERKEHNHSHNNHNHGHHH